MCENNTETKKCTICGEIKPLTTEYFHYRNDNKKFRNECIECRNKKEREIKIEKATKDMTEEEKIEYINIMNTRYEILKENKNKLKLLRTNCKDGYKICISCLEELPSTNEYFYNKSKSEDGLNSSCISCIKKQRNNDIIEKGNDKLKQCTFCKELKPATTEYFSINRASKDGLNCQCKDCRNKGARNFRKQKKLKDKNKIKTYTVYKLTNKINNKVYIGITNRNVKRRWENGYGYKRNKQLYNDILEYGWDEGFNKEIIQEGLTQEEAENFEILLIKKEKLKDSDNCYNIQLGGKSGNRGISGLVDTKCKKVSCNDMVFNSIASASKYFGVDKSTMGYWLNGKYSTPQKFIDMNLHIIGEENKVRPRISKS